VIGSRSTSILRATAGDASCTGSVDDETIDFSSSLTPGHGPLKIVVTNGGHDYFCQLYYGCINNPWLLGYDYVGLACNTFMSAGQGAYCPTRPANTNDTMNGTVDVQINGTGL
jgi:hypothetical protein